MARPPPTDHRHPPDPDAALRLVSSFLGRIDAALGMVAAIDTALLLLLAGEAWRGTGRRPIVLSVAAPSLLLAASLVFACRGLLARRDDRAADAHERLQSSSRRFALKWTVLKLAALFLCCAVAWRFVAIRL